MHTDLAILKRQIGNKHKIKLTDFEMRIQELPKGEHIDRCLITLLIETGSVTLPQIAEEDFQNATKQDHATKTTVKEI